MRYYLLLALVLIASCTPKNCIDATTKAEMSLSEAIQIAESSTCANEGALKSTYVCNENTGTWWIDIDKVMEGCNPACVVNVNTKQAEVNYRCTGLLPS